MRAQEERLEGDNQYACGPCGARRDATRRIRLRQLPPILNLQLLRFVYDRTTWAKRKLKNTVLIPEVLDMAPYVCDGSRPDEEHLYYDLTAMLIHKGPSAYSGHYMAYIRADHRAPWLLFDDERVERLTGSRWRAGATEDSLQLAAAGARPADRVVQGYQKSNNAYMLVYVRRAAEPASAEYTSATPEQLLPGHARDWVENDNRLAEEALREHEGSRRQLEQSIGLAADETLSIYEALQENADSDSDAEESAGDATDATSPAADGASAKRRCVDGGAGVCDESYEFIAIDWLRQWLSTAMSAGAETVRPQRAPAQPADAAVAPLRQDPEPRTANGAPAAPRVPPIDNTTLLCPHGRLDVTRLDRTKRVRTMAADVLYAKFSGGPRLPETLVCADCVMQEAQRRRANAVLAADQRIVRQAMAACADTGSAHQRKPPRRRAILQQTVRADEPTYWIDRALLNAWLTAADARLCAIEPTAMTELDGRRVFHAGVRCQHGGLSADPSQRRLLPASAWDRVAGYFCDAGSSRERHGAREAPCADCVKQQQSQRQLETYLRSRARDEGSKLSRLVDWQMTTGLKSATDHPPAAPEGRYVLLPAEFMHAWVMFATQDRTTEVVPPPTRVDFHALLCEHGLLAVDPVESTPNPLAAIVSMQEWSHIAAAYETVGSPVCVRAVTDMSCSDVGTVVLTTEPALCAACCAERRAAHHAECSSYSRATVYVWKRPSNGGPQSSTVPPTPTPPRQRHTRSLRTTTRGRMAFTVSSTDTLRDLQTRIMAVVSAAPMDQHLYLRGKPLPDDPFAVLGSLGIRPGDELDLVCDAAVVNADDDLDVDMQPLATREDGFKGACVRAHACSRVCT